MQDLGAQWLASEPFIRASAFFGILAVMMIMETLAPRRERSLRRRDRWPANLGIVVLNSVAVRLLFPLAATGIAAMAIQNDWGLFNHIDVPAPVAIVVSMVVLDFAIYLQHVMFHAVPVLWRLHRVHHADLDFDVTTGARFHPIEILLSMLIKSVVIILLGPPIIAVLLFEIILNGMAMFNHSNVRLPAALDALLRLFIVTPDVHRVHHSIEYDESNRNFGFNLSCWDRLCGTWQAQPRAGHEDMILGINQYREPSRVARLSGLLTLPFISFRSNNDSRHAGERQHPVD